MGTQRAAVKGDLLPELRPASLISREAKPYQASLSFAPLHRQYKHIVKKSNENINLKIKKELQELSTALLKNTHHASLSFDPPHAFFGGGQNWLFYFGTLATSEVFLLLFRSHN